jgi:hypothetical protein
LALGLCWPISITLARSMVVPKVESGSVDSITCCCR